MNDEMMRAMIAVFAAMAEIWQRSEASANEYTVLDPVVEEDISIEED